MRTTAVGAVALVILASGGEVGPARAEHAGSHVATAYGDRLVIGHRGDEAGAHTENTIASMRSAVAAGAGAVEFDVRVTADDDFVVMHDSELDRTTTCDGRVRAKTLGWIRTNCRGRHHREPIPALTDVLDWARPSGVSLLVELKEAPGWDADRTREVVGAIEDRGLELRAQFLSFEPDLLALVEQVAPEMQTLLIISGSRTPDLAVGRFDGVTIDPDEATPGLVDRLHGIGMTVYGRTSNHPADWETFWQAGVDGFLTDRPGAAADALPHTTGSHR